MPVRPDPDCHCDVTQFDNGSGTWGHWEGSQLEQPHGLCKTSLLMTQFYTALALGTVHPPPPPSGSSRSRCCHSLEV